MEFYEKPSLEDLEHYGVLGMKWGVRRTPEQLGHHKIKKGTKMYRATTNKSESTSGPKYVTYLPPDRDNYRGLGSAKLKVDRGESTDAKLYENSYKLTKDLNIPSRDTVKKAYDKVMANNETKKQALRDFYEDRISRDKEYYYNRHLGTSWQEQIKTMAKEWADDTVERWGDSSVEYKFAVTADAIAASPILKSAIISELKKQGYNAMVDESEVGGEQKLYDIRRGVEPILIFDGDDTLSKTGTSEVTPEITREATKRYRKWFDVANSRKNRYKPW